MSSSDEDEWSIRRDLTTRKGKHDERQSSSNKRSRATSTPNEDYDDRNEQRRSQGYSFSDDQSTGRTSHPRSPRFADTGRYFTFEARSPEHQENVQRNRPNNQQSRIQADRSQSSASGSTSDLRQTSRSSRHISTTGDDSDIRSDVVGGPSTSGRTPAENRARRYDEYDNDEDRYYARQRGEYPDRRERTTGDQDTGERSLLGMYTLHYNTTRNRQNNTHIMSITDRMTDVASTLVSASAPIARALEQGLNIIGQREAAQAVGLARQAAETIRTTGGAVNFIQQNQQQITNYLTVSVEQAKKMLAGSTTTDEPAAEAARVSGAPTEQDPQGVPSAPQLSTTHDPLPATDPAIAFSQEQSGSLNSNALNFPSDHEIMDTIAHATLDTYSPNLSSITSDDEERMDVSTSTQAQYDTSYHNDTTISIDRNFADEHQQPIRIRIRDLLRRQRQEQRQLQTSLPLGEDRYRRRKRRKLLFDEQEFIHYMRGIEYILKARNKLIVHPTKNRLVQHWRMNLQMLNNRQWVGKLILPSLGPAPMLKGTL